MAAGSCTAQGSWRSWAQPAWHSALGKMRTGPGVGGVGAHEHTAQAIKRVRVAGDGPSALSGVANASNAPQSGAADRLGHLPTRRPAQQAIADESRRACKHKAARC